MVQMLDGVIIDSKFRLIEAIGKGGTSVVYRGQQLSLNNREVAVKVMSFDPDENPDYALRFKREAAIVATLEHPYILPIFEYGSDDERRLLYLVTPLMSNGSLKRHILRNGPLPLGRSIALLERIGSALHYAHEQGVVHRDINPRNILLNNFGDPILSDFGLAKVDGGMQITALGYMAGTKAYMGPEQWVGEELDRRCDIYSLGVSLYEILSGVQPFTGDTPRELALQHLSEPPPPLTEKAPHIPLSIEAVLRKAMAKRPEDRYPTVQDLIVAYRRAAEEAPDLAHPIQHSAALDSEITAEFMEAAPGLHTENDEGLTFIPPSEKTERLATIALVFDIAREAFDSGLMLNTIANILKPEFPELAIEVTSIETGSTVVTLTMLAAACNSLYARLQENPDLFAPYPLIKMEYQERTWQRNGLAEKLQGARWLRVIAAVLVVAFLSVSGVLAWNGIQNRNITPTPPPELTTAPLAALPVQSTVQASATLPPTEALTQTQVPTEQPSATDLPTATTRPSATATTEPSDTPVPPTATATLTPSATHEPVLLPAMLDGINALSAGRMQLAGLVNTLPTATPRYADYPTRVLVFVATNTPPPPDLPGPGPAPLSGVTTTTTGGNDAQDPSDPAPSTSVPPTDIPPTDVPAPTDSLPPTDTPKRECGNGICEPGENRNKCPEDCPT